MHDDLIARLEAANGPDRELDRDIALALGLYPHTVDLGCYPDLAMVGECGQTWTPPAYTASIDAALTLVPEGWSYTVAWLHRNQRATVAFFHAKLDEQRAEAPTLALAIVTAALKASGQGEG